MRRSLGIAEDDPLDMAKLAAAFDRVRDSCRFWRHDFVVQLPILESVKWRYDTADPRTKLVIKLVEYDLVPKLGEPLSEVDQALRRTAMWTRHFCEQDEWVLKFHYWTGGTYRKVSDLEVDGIYSPSAGLYADVGFLFTHAGAAATQKTSLVSRPGYTAMSSFAGDTRFSLLTGRMAQATFSLTGSKKLDGLFQANFNFGMSASTSQATEPRFLLTVDPVVLVHEAHRSGSRVELDGDVLVIDRPRAKWRIDTASGRILDLDLNDGHQQQVRIVTVNRASSSLTRQLEAFDALPERSDQENLLESLVQWMFEMSDQLAPNAPIIPPTVRTLILGWIDGPLRAKQLVDETRKDRKLRKALELRVADGKAELGFSWEGLLNAASTESSYLFKRETWPWTFCREFAFYQGDLLDNDVGSLWKEELLRTFRRDDTGPIAYSVLAHWEVLDRDGVQVGLSKLDDGSFAREVEMLTTPDTGMMKLLATVVPVVQSLPEEDTDWLCGLAGDDVAPKLEEVTRLLRKLDASSDEALQAPLRALLEGEIRERVEADLRAAAQRE